MQTPESVQLTSGNASTDGVIVNSLIRENVSKAYRNNQYRKVMVVAPSAKTAQLGYELCTAHGFDPRVVGIQVVANDSPNLADLTKLAKDKGMDALYLDTGKTVGNNPLVPSDSVVLDCVY